ncbi:holin [Staphylococcus phage vB_SurM-PSU4]|nr:holin [Staphylococcus phage vB_SurM-PSU4]
MSKDTNQKKPKVFLGQNLSTRVRSPYFWTGVVGILGSAVVSFGGLIGVDLSAQVDNVTANSSKIIEFIFLILGLLGVSVDPNSKGRKDSEIVRTSYKKPRNDKDPNEFVQWQENAKQTSAFEIDEYENNAEPDTDDSDEVLAIEDEIDGGSAPSQEEEDTEEHGKVFAEDEVK